MNLQISEVFYSLQGEGPSVGVPSYFIRLHGCSVGCSYCDSKYTWKSGEPISVPPEKFLNYYAIPPQARRIVITGGEPLEQSAPLATLLRTLSLRGCPIEVETSLTLAPSDELLSLVSQWNCSLKLSSSGAPKERRLIDSAISRMVSHQATYFPKLNRVIWKFVISSEEDLKEVDWLRHRYSLCNVWVMPEGVTREDLQQKSLWLAERALELGYCFTPRLHVMLWGAKRGV